jgi:hypothetical protein
MIRLEEGLTETYRLMRMNWTSFKIRAVCAKLAMMLVAVGMLARCVSARSFSTEAAQKKDKKERELKWEPPDVDARVPTISTTPACSLPEVLSQAGQRVNELIDHLQNFVAHERVRYEQTDREDAMEMTLTGKFDYVVDFGDRAGELNVHESRTLLAGTKDEHLGEILDKGMPALALIFYPTVQSDYEMRCGGYSPWNDHPAWLVYFRQSKEKRARTMTVRTAKGDYPVGLKGRVWIARDSGQIMHLETNLTEAIPAIDLRMNSVSVDYAPVKFQSQDVEVWLPQFAVGYSDFAKRRMIIEHTFTDFQLFSVQTEEVIQKPKQP